MIGFDDMLIMIGPAGAECQHSIRDDDGRVHNNFWAKGSDGNLYVRNSAYVSGLNPAVDVFKNGTFKNVDLDSIKNLSFEILSCKDVFK